MGEVYHNSDDAVQVKYQYIYSSDGQLAKQQEIRNGSIVRTYGFEYDSLGRLIRSREDSGNESIQRTEHLYDSANRLVKQNWVVGERNFKQSYHYNATDGTMDWMEIVYDDAADYRARDKLTYTYDDLNRLTKVLDTENNVTPFFTRNYTYKDLSSSRTTTRLAQYDYCNPNDNDSIVYGNSYVYDANGNITQINEVYTNNGSDATRVLATYVYDELNQLKKETRYTYSDDSATAASTTVVDYTIDKAGNIQNATTKVNNSTQKTVAYTYGNAYWADRLTAITVNGTTKNITYADYGNPSTWYNGEEYSDLSWTQGRRLSSITKGSTTSSYEYDMSGIRSVKIADGLRHEYVTQSGRVVRETVTNASTGAFQYILDFTYDESGHPLTMRKYSNAAQTSYKTYHYVLNAQGDVMKLLHGANTTVATYSYDAWGNVLSVKDGNGADITASSNIALINPFRYRGYYYDDETGFYYLQSRYYDPQIGRFINADSYASTGQDFLGHNMFAYCNNNPVILSDKSGKIGFIASLCIAIVVSVVVEYGGQVVENYESGKSGGEAWIPNSIGGLVSSGFSGAMSAIPGAGAIYAEVADTFLSPAIEQGLDSIIYADKQWEWSEYAVDVGANILSNGVNSIIGGNKPVPKNIRDIKAEAVEQGIKGTRRLTSYLQRKQLSTIMKNAFRNKVSSYIVDILHLEHD